jgi:drug/metabolite transporter (DMT)-like permease
MFIKMALDEGVQPAFLAWARVALGAAILLPLAFHRKALRGAQARFGAIAAYAACEIVVPFILISVGEQYVSSSLTAILIATMPLIVALLSLRLNPTDNLAKTQLLGLVIGFGGVFALVGVDIAGRADELIGAALVLVATLGYATAPIIVDRHLTDLDPLGAVAVSLSLAAVVLSPAAFWSPPDTALSLEAVSSLVVLGVVCTALGLVIFFRLIAEAGPFRASIITYVNPLVAVVLGVLALNESLGVASITGLVLILAGSWLSTNKQVGASKENVAGELENADAEGVKERI